jgi:DNA-binding transcriptional LysR family regulator
MPITVGKTVLVPRLAELARTHPGLRFDLSFSDRYVDVVKEGFDAVVRIGPLSDSTLVARRIGAQEMIVIGSPRYLRERGAPRLPEDLARHDCIVFRNPTTGRPRPWQFRHGRRSFEIEPESRLRMNDGEAMVEAVAADLGLAQLPDYMAQGAQLSGRVVEVLADWRPPSLPISLVYPSGRLVTPRLRALIDVFSATPFVPPTAPVARAMAAASAKHAPAKRAADRRPR